MEDVAFGHRAEPHATPTTMDQPGHWHYVAIRLMAHMGTYSLDQMNGLHWLWHRRAALRIRKAMQRHNIWVIPGSPGYQGHASGRRRPRSQEPPGKRHAITPQNSTRGNHPGCVPPLAHTKAPSDHSPRRGTEAALTSHGCRAARQNGTRGQGTLAGRGPAAAQRLPQHAESSSTRVWTEAMEARTTRRRNRHHLPPFLGAGPRGHAPSRRTSPPFPRRLSERNRQRSTQTPTREQTVRSARPLPPSQGWRPARYRKTARRKHTQQRAPAANKRPEQGVGGQTPQSLPPQAGRDGTCRGPIGPIRHGAPHPGFNAAKLPGRGGRITTTGTRRRRPGSGQRKDRGLRPSEVQWLTAHHRVLSDVPATGALHGECTWGTPWHHPRAPLPNWHHTGPGPGDHAPPTSQTTTTEEQGPL